MYDDCVAPCLVVQCGAAEFVSLCGGAARVYAWVACISVAATLNEEFHSVEALTAPLVHVCRVPSSRPPALVEVATPASHQFVAYMGKGDTKQRISKWFWFSFFLIQFAIN